MSRFFRSLAAIFRPPFNGLALVVVLYYAWAHMVYPHNDVMHGNLPDPDDYMYLTQVLDWLNGQGWYDNIQHRLDPPQGTPIHFSRFAQIPIAAGVLFFKTLGLKPHGAAMVTALIYPLVLLGCCLAVLRRVVSCVVPARWAGASAYVALFSSGLLFEFMPGHVDHHGLVIILILAATGCVLRLIEQPEDHKAAIGAGLVLGFATMIALECLPWVLLLSALLGVWSMAKGGKAARSGALFAASLVIGNVVFLALTRPPATIFEADILTYSIIYVILAAAIVLPFFGVALTSKAAPATRWATGLALALLCGGLFLRRFPELVFGPYGGIDPRLLPLLLDNVEEAKPLLQTDDAWAHIRNLMSTGLIALPAALAFLWRARAVAVAPLGAEQSREQERWKWGVVAALVATALGLTVFYQYRFMGMVSALAVIPLTALLQRGWLTLAHWTEGRKKTLAEIGLLLLVGPLPAIIVPSLFDSRSFNTGFLLFAVDSGHTPCDMSGLTPILRDPQGLGDRQRLIASYMELGPELLFRTEDSVLAAPFHMDVQGNLDAAQFFSTPYPDEAEKIARQRGVDLVVACHFVPHHYLGAADLGTPMIERLFKGPVPPWLERVPAPRIDNFVIYKTKPDSAAAP